MSAEPAGASAPQSGVRFRTQPVSEVKTYYPGKSAKFINARTGEKLLIHPNSLKGQAILRGEKGESARREFIRQISEQEGRPNVAGTVVENLPAATVSRPPPATSALKRVSNTTITFPTNKIILLRTATTVDDYYPELLPVQYDFKELSQPVLTEYGQYILNTVSIHSPETFVNIYTDNTPAARFTATSLFPSSREIRVFNADSVNAETGPVIVIGSRHFFRSISPGRISENQIIPPLTYLTAPIGRVSLFDGPPTKLLDNIPLILTKTTDNFFPEQVMPTYTMFPPTKATGLSVKSITRINLFYQTFLRDLSVPPTVLPEKIIKILNSTSHNYDAIVSYISNRHPNVATPQSIDTLYGQFCKVYACHSKLPFTRNWPPPNYSPTAVPLYSILGYTDESTIESDVRVLTILSERTQTSYSSLIEFLTALRNTSTTLSDIDRLNSLLREPITTQEIDALYRHEELDTTMLKILIRAQGHQRLLEGVLNLTPFEFLLKEANYTNYSESSGISFYVVPVELYSLTNPPKDRNQMYIAFFPKCGDSRPEDFDKNNLTNLELSDMSWIEFDYDFQTTTNIEANICNSYNTVRNASIGKEFTKIGVVQGNRTELFPHPEFMIAMSKGVRSAHPRMREIWPEWFNETERTRWIDRVMTQWQMDIGKMPTATKYELFMKEIQQHFFLYAKKEIYPTGYEPITGAAEALQQQTVPIMESGIPAMLSRVNMNANKDPNAAYLRFNRNIRPFLKFPTTNIQTRKRGFWSGESKDMYRRTLKRQLYKLMRATGASFTYEDAIAELRYIYEQLAENSAIPATVVHERMKDWVMRYVADMPASYRVQIRKENPEGLARLDQIASLFSTASPQSARMILPEAIRIAHPTELPSRKESMEAAIRRVVFSPQLIRGKELYNEIQRIVSTYPDVVKESPELAAAVAQVTAPPRRGFFARTFGGRNVAYNDAIQSAAQKVLSALEQTARSVSVPVSKSEPQSLKVVSASPVNGSNVGLQQIIIKKPKGGSTDAYNYILETQRSNMSSREQFPLQYIRTNQEARNEYPGVPIRIEEQGGGSRQKTASNSRMRKGRMKHKTRKQQRGGAATPMPLGWYQPGGQFIGTTSEPTGVGLAGSNASWARLPLAVQSGGMRRKQGGFHRHGQFVADQQGGFTPSIMGAGFAEAGMRLLPAAAYMGYNQYNNYRKHQRKTHRKSRK